MIGRLGLVLAIGITGTLAAAEESPYIRLYGQRVVLAKADVKRQEAETKFQAAHLGRIRQLVSKGAASREEYDRALADHDKSVAQEEVYRAKVGEEEATLDVVKMLVQTSQPVPLCRP